MPRPKKQPEQIEEDFNLDDIFGHKEEVIESVIDEDVMDNPNIQPVPDAPKKRAVVSFDQPITLDEPTVPKSNKRRFIIKKVEIDKFNSKSSRVELTPSTCDICAFDVASKLGGWYNVPTEERPRALKALAKHKEVVHTASQQHIIDEDQMPTKWLGGGKL